MDNLLNDNNKKVKNITEYAELVYSSDSDNELNKPLKKKCKKSNKLNLCPGCFPVFQPGQIAHYGPNSCIGYDDTVLEIDEEIEHKKKKFKKDNSK